MNHILTPPSVLDAYAANRLQEESAAVCLFVDTAGFTPLTSALMAHGTEGAEVLAQVLADIFTPLLAIVYAHGGYVAGFAGDAIKAIFPGLSAASHQRAATAAWQIRQQMLAHPVQNTRFGAFRFAVKVTMASGPVEWRIWRAAETENNADFQQQAALLFGGAALAQALAADPLVQAGEIVMTAAVAAQLPPAATLEAVADHFRLCAWSVTTPVVVPSATHYGPAALAERLPLANHFFPTELLERQTQGEFRQVVTLFVNLQALPSGTAATEFAGALFRLLAQYGGYLCRIGQIGDRDPGGTLLLFWGAPTSHENDVVRALHFALALPAVAPTPMRIGITTALAYAGFVGSPLREEYTCYGAHVNLAARQMVMAGWGEIWLDEATTHLAGPAFTVSQPATLRFKGFAEERAIYRLLRHQGDNAERFYTGALVGRAAELAQLQSTLAPLTAGRTAGLITIIGEAGMGKSRLVYELQVASGKSQVAGSGTFTPQWFRCQSDEILRQPLNPFRYWLRSYFNQSTSADEIANRAAFTAKLDDVIHHLRMAATDLPPATCHLLLATELDRTRSFLGALVDLHWPDSLYSQVEPQLRLENTLVALKSLILAESLRQPVILHLEDTHWLDADSQTLLTRLLHNVVDYPLAVIVTQRPGEETGRQGEGETRGQGEVTQLTIRLTTLTADEMTALAAAQLQGTPAPALVTLLQERAEGNPFFVEQLLLYLREREWLVQGADGWQVRTEQAATTLLPSGARALLVARLDQLPQPVKEVVQTAAVLGREFDTNVLAQMLADDQTLAAKLAVADRAAIWYAMTQARYLFRHALLREAAYDMQLRTRLRSLHHLAGAALEQVYGADLTPYFGELAYHYDQAEVVDKAVQWYSQAGEQAASGYANHDAVRYFSRALDLTKVGQTEDRFKLLLGREAVYNILGKVEAQRNDIAKMEELAKQLADPVGQAQAALRSAILYRLMGNYESALNYIQRSVTWAEQTNNVQLVASVYHHWGRVHWEQGNYLDGQRRLDQALQLARSGHYLQQEAESLTDLGSIHLYQGEYSTARTYYQQALTLYNSLGERKGEISGLVMLGSIAYETGDYEGALTTFNNVLTMCRSIGYLYGEAFSLGNLAMNYIYLGAYHEANSCLRQAITSCQERGDQQGEGIYLDSLAVIYLHSGRYAEATLTCRQALAIQQAIGDRRFEAYSLSYLGDALCELGKLTEAEMSYQAALAIRQALGEENLSLEARLGLAQVALRQQRITAALADVTTVLDWIALHGIEGIEFPIHLYLNSYKVLAAAGEAERAIATLTAGYELLHQRAARLQDAQLRQTFLEAVPFNRELIVIWQQVTQMRSM